MHARNRSPGNGYRAAHSGGMGGVVATASRVSPDSSIRGHGGGYNSEYRSYNRGGFGRGQSRQFNNRPPAPLPHKGGGGGDIFMEAGKLAAEYLIAKGLLPANVLSGKWQNGNLKNLVGRVQDADSGRASALSRLGEASVGSSDSGLPGRRRSSDEYSNEGSRSGFRGRKRTNESLKNYGSDLNREMGRSGSWSERSRASADGDDESSEVFPRHRDVQQQVSNEGERVDRNSSIPELARASDTVLAEENEIARVPHYTLEKLKFEDNGGAKDSASSSSKKDSDKGIDEKDDDAKVSSMEAEKNKDDEMEEAQDTRDDVATLAFPSDEGSHATSEKTTTDLLSLCRFAKFPTRTRSSVAFRGSKLDAGHPLTVNDNAHEGEPSEESGPRDENVSAYNISGDGLQFQINESDPMNLDELSMPAAENDSELDRGSVKDAELPDFGRINNTMIMDHGENHTLNECGDTSVGNKKPRQSSPWEDAESNAGLSLLDPPIKRQPLEDLMTSQGRAGTLPSDVTSYPKSNVEPHMEYAEEKPLVTGSFRTCDLNLMEAASEPSDQHQGTSDTGFLFASPRGNGKQAININLSMHSNDIHKVVPNRYGTYSLDGRDIEVIDLENDPMHNDRDLTTNSDGRNGNVIAGLGGFPGNVHNANEIRDSSDSNYGLMISELMGGDIPNCSSSVPADVDSLHNDMTLDNGEGILGVDDPIYMSLGEIPLSFLRGGWEQPTQDYGKPF